MATTERLANLGYVLVGKETVAGTDVVPALGVPMYEESCDTNMNFVKLKPVVGHKFATNKTIAGLRSHEISMTVMFEGNTAGHFVNALLTKGTTTGAGPYTHPFTQTGDSASYTFDVSIGGNLVKRFFGVKLNKIEPSMNDNEWQLKLEGAALGSFAGREIATVATTTLTLKTDYDANASRGLVVGDLVRIYKASTGATLDTTIATINADGITITVGVSAAAFAAGDMIYLRSQTPTYNNLDPFTWGNTIVGFGATASAALTNATTALQTRVDQGSNLAVIHDFNDKTGEHRSGAKDPATLVRTLVDAELTIKRPFDGPEDVQNWNSVAKTACVVRMFAGSTNQYEARFTFNNMTTDTPLPKLKTGEIGYSEIAYILNQDSSDAQGIDVKIINNLATI